MNLFDFLMSNAFVVIIIAGFIWNVLKRYSEEAKKGSEQKRTVQPRRKEIDVRKEVEQAKQFKKQAASMQAMLEEAKALHQPQSTVQENKQNDVKSFSQPVKKQRSPRKNGETKANISVSFSKKQAVQGIILSEILGPPKAKRK